MNLTPQQKSVIERVVNVFETGSAAGNYADISIFHDGPGERRQVTYGRSQTTEYGHLRELVSRYCDAPGAAFAGVLRPYLARIGIVPLVDDHTFLELLEHAGEDDVMHRVQDTFFDEAYFQPAERWADANGLREALSMLVIYDSFIHSGSILASLRARFAEVPPARGGDEKRWIAQYTAARQEWLANHPRTILHSTVYRTHCLLGEIAHGNWDLAELPIQAHGVPVMPA